MANINIISVGKIKEKFFKDALSEYEKRLSRFCKIKFIEVPDRPIPNNASAAEEQQILEREGADIIDKIGRNDFVISLCVEGKNMSSIELAGQIDLAFMETSTITFVVGGSLGLSNAVKEKSRLRLSMSEMTFPHNLAIVMIAEQIYRAFKINNNETYHK